MTVRGDHPRIRGEHRPRLAWPGRDRGIIPAYAGSTYCWEDPTDTDRDHPRIRGEHSTDTPGAFDKAGSSPHTRGARVAQIPGKIVKADHPRIRGEHRGALLDRVGPGGSSPHTRGAPPPGLRRRAGRGIIPAYAGSTRSATCRKRYPSDHPRIRGEHRMASRRHVQVSGSSPHTRGALDVPRLDLLRVRIIPAYAGSTARPVPGWDGWEGSSPHTRGAHLRQHGAGVDPGIIPAYAGSTCGLCGELPVDLDHPRIRGEHWSAPGGSRLRGDHPRIRGEHSIGMVIGWFGKGSSPHTRGARRSILNRAMESRIIPAYAGST